MSDPYIEDNGDEFPINNLVRCGQAAFENEPPTRASAIKTRSSALPRVSQTKFFPKVTPVPRR
ncbi:hypothetical protein TO66_09465 [Pseudomonas sp. MRSN 12121]|nr:hypothetical protein [Pseudomonas sp. MRSN 12121]AJO77515.1 hypothetical protein TO66_09465 [Pseudomonas sp. MRSN 12121]